MTLKELSQIYFLEREIELNNEEISKLDFEIKKYNEQLACIRSKAESPPSSNYDGMPKNLGYKNKLENDIIKITQIEKSIEVKKSLKNAFYVELEKNNIRCLQERNKIEAYISRIPSSLLRLIFTYRFVNGMTWERVSESIGKNTTVDSVKKMCYRYLHEN